MYDARHREREADILRPRDGTLLPHREPEKNHERDKTHHEARRAGVGFLDRHEKRELQKEKPEAKNENRADIPEVPEDIAEEIPAGRDPVSEKEDQPRAEKSDRDKIKRREAAIGKEVLGRDAAGTESDAGEGREPDTDKSSGLHEGISAVRRYFLYVKVILSQCDGTEIRSGSFFIRLDPAEKPDFSVKMPGSPRLEQDKKHSQTGQILPSSTLSMPLGGGESLLERVNKGERLPRGRSDPPRGLSPAPINTSRKPNHDLDWTRDRPGYFLADLQKL